MALKHTEIVILDIVTKTNEHVTNTLTLTGNTRNYDAI